jgi:hypothetical protein
MRVTTEALAPVTGRVLEAALLGEGWPEALSRFAEAAGVTGAVIVNDAAQGRTTLLPTESVAEPVADYRVGKTPPDPRAALVSPRFGDGFVTDFDAFTPDEIRRDPFYASFLRPIGLGWHACALLSERPSGDRLYISLKRAHRYGHYERGDVECRTPPSRPCRMQARSPGLCSRPKLEGRPVRSQVDAIWCSQSTALVARPFSWAPAPKCSAATSCW